MRPDLNGETQKTNFKLRANWSRIWNVLAFLFFGLLAGDFRASAIQIEPAGAGGHAEEPIADCERLCRVLREICDCVMREHSAPPPRQALYLGAARALAQINHVDQPRNLAEEFSRVAAIEQFELPIRAIWDRADDDSKFDAEASLHMAASGMLRAASPATRYATAKENRVQKQLAENQYVGIGIRLQFTDGLPEIAEAFFGGPAYLAGVKNGDRILEVDGWACKDQPLDETVERLRGPKGSNVGIKVLNRDDESKAEREYKITRNVVPIDSVVGGSRHADGNWNFAADDTGRVAVMKIASIVGSTAAEFAERAAQIERQGFQCVVLDFRGAVTADLHHVVMLADMLFDGVEIGTIADDDGERTILARPDYYLRDRPLFVVADPAVSGEVFLLLSALKEHRHAQVVGQPIRSDGACRKVVDLPDDLGAIHNFEYAVIQPLSKKRNVEVGETEMGTAGGFGRLMLPADVPASPEEQLETAVRTANKTIDQSANSSQSSEK